MTTKEKMKILMESQPDDSRYNEVLRELAFADMIERGLEDARKGRVISNEEMGKYI
jgi:predicted transcriptional regulator